MRLIGSTAFIQQEVQTMPATLRSLGITVAVLSLAYAIRAQQRHDYTNRDTQGAIGAKRQKLEARSSAPRSSAPAGQSTSCRSMSRARLVPSCPESTHWGRQLDCM